MIGIISQIVLGIAVVSAYFMVGAEDPSITVIGFLQMNLSMLAR